MTDPWRYESIAATAVRRINPWTNFLFFEGGATAPSGAPQRSDDDVLVVVREVEVTANLVEVQSPRARCRTYLVRRADAWEQCKKLERGTELIFEQTSLIAMFTPSAVFDVDLVLRRDREQDTAVGHRDLSSRNTSTASTTRPAATSDSD